MRFYSDSLLYNIIVRIDPFTPGHGSMIGRQEKFQERWQIKRHFSSTRQDEPPLPPLLDHFFPDSNTRFDYRPIGNILRTNPHRNLPLMPSAEETVQSKSGENSDFSKST